MKYQSELIKEIIDTRGHEKSSLHYQSECVETWIEENKGAYPKLCDYESEWLNYIVENPIGDFPYETLTDVTTATINNVVPYAYKSAILSGQTLVNIVQNQFPVATWVDNINNSYFRDSETAKLFKPDTDYLFIFEGADTITLLTGVSAFFTTNNNDISGKKLKLRTLSELTSKTFIPHFKSSVGGALSAEEKASIRFMIIEYQDGMENWDIPYFEGMQSVKMPVLTTTGKNLFDGISFKKWWVNVAEGVQKTETGNNKSILINIKPNTKYRLSGEGINRGAYAFLSANFEELSRGGNTTGTRQTEESPSGSKYLLWYLHNEDISNCSNVQVEEGAVATSYEPYKTNILTVNEDVTLRGIGDVKDELNLLTGEFTERVGEIVLDGSEDWVFGRGTTHTVNGMVYGFKIKIPNLYTPEWSGTTTDTIVCDKLKVTSHLNQFTGEVYNSISQCSPTEIQIMIKAINNSSNDTLNELKRMLSENPVTVVYPVNDVIKTVDLTVVNQDGENVSLKPIEGTMHLSTSSETIKPLFSGEIPVEAITQNLASFIEE